MSCGAEDFTDHFGGRSCAGEAREGNGTVTLEGSHRQAKRDARTKRSGTTFSRQKVLEDFLFPICFFHKHTYTHTRTLKQFI